MLSQLRIYIAVDWLLDIVALLGAREISPSGHPFHIHPVSNFFRAQLEYFGFFIYLSDKLVFHLCCNGS